MSVSLICRSVVLAAYLAGVGLGRRADLIAAVAGLAVIVVWTTALLRDRYARTGIPAAVAGEKSVAGLPK
jgi:hypothetical protein